MERVYVVPGIGESTLLDTTPLATVIWIGIPTVLLGYFGAIRLGPNGTDPGPPDGIPLTVGNLFPSYAQEPSWALRDQMRDDGYAVFGWPWDWRKSLLTAGDQLAADIRADVPAGQQCSIIAHSAGGLVARRAWSNLVGTGEQGRIRRIVTLGTPHWGSYYAALAFSGQSTLIDALLSINTGIGATSPFYANVAGYKLWTRRQIADLLLTFPSLYELLPVVGAPDGITDPHRADLYQAANWGAGVFVEQAWLTHANTVYRQWVLSADSLPPDDVMTTVAGTDQATPYTLADPGNLGELDAIGYNSAGDDTVPTGSAWLFASQQVSVRSEHSALFPDAVRNGNARAWLSARRSPTPIPPPMEVDARLQMNGVAQFPGTTVVGAGSAVGGYRDPAGGDC